MFIRQVQALPEGPNSRVLGVTFLFFLHPPVFQEVSHLKFLVIIEQVHRTAEAVHQIKIKSAPERCRFPRKRFLNCHYSIIPI
jgi:hypothetical protein